MDVWHIIRLFIAFQFLFMGAVLFMGRRQHGYGHGLFAVLILLFGGCVMGQVFWADSRSVALLTSLELMNQILMVSCGPLLYGVVRYKATGVRVSLKDHVHLLPYFLVSLLYFFLVYPSWGVGTIARDDSHFFPTLVQTYPYIAGVLCTLTLAYALVVHIRFLKGAILDGPSRFWLGTLNWSFALTGIAMIGYLPMLQFGLEGMFQRSTTFLLLFNAGATTYIVLFRTNVIEPSDTFCMERQEKYRTSGLPPLFAQELQEQLIRLMEVEKPYLRSDLQLDDLAAMLNVSRHHASQLINASFKQNFYEFVNQYRVEEAKTLLVVDSGLGIEDVAIKCGFNNRISFYRIFKKSVGLAPSAFRIQQMAND